MTEGILGGSGSNSCRRIRLWGGIVCFWLDLEARSFGGQIFEILFSNRLISKEAKLI